MPGLNTNYASFRDGTQAPPLVFDRAEGLKLFSPEGRDYIDLVCSMGTSIWGNSQPEYLQAIQQQLEKIYACGSAVAHTTVEIELAEKIVDLVPCAEQLRFCLSGSEADQLAVRMARSYTGKPYVLRFEGHYHGWLEPLFCGSSAPETGHLPFPQPAGTDSEGLSSDVYQDTLMIPWNDIQRFERTLEAHADKIGLVLMEAIMCNSACCPPRPGYLEAVRELCNKHNVLLAFDEIITGFRVGLGGAQELFDVTPDLAIFGKALSGGMPLSCVAGKKEVMSELKENRVLAIGTFNSFPLAMASSIASLNMLERDDQAYYRRVDVHQKRLIEGLHKSAKKFGHRILTQGPRGFFYLDFTEANTIYSPADLAHSNAEKRQKFRAIIHEEGVAIGGNNRFSISGELTETEIDEALDRIDKAMSKL